MTVSSSLLTLKSTLKWTKFQIEYWKGNYTSFNKAGPNKVDTAIYKFSRKLRQKTVLNKFLEIKVLKVKGKNSKQETVIIHTVIQMTPKYDWFYLFYFQN